MSPRNNPLCASASLREPFFLYIVLVWLVACGTVSAQSPATRPTDTAEKVWRFNRTNKWNGWQPTSQIQDVRFEEDCVSFRAGANDPLIVGPLFEWSGTTNGQHIEIDIDCEAPGWGEFFFTNTTQGVYGGFSQKWHVPYTFPTAGRQIIPIWPFWESLEKVIKVRFDPPSGMRCKLYGIRIVDGGQLPGTPSWDFSGTASSWQPMYAASLEPSTSGLRVHARQPMAMIATAVEPFAADRRSVLRLSVDCPGEHSICFYWADRENAGLWGEPLELPVNDSEPIVVDLRKYPEWKGTITNLAIGFGTFGRETLTLTSLAVEENDPDKPLARLKHMGYASGVARPGRPARMRAIVEHAGGPTIPAGNAIINTDDNASCIESTMPVPPLTPGKPVELTWNIVPHVAGQTRLTLSLNGQSFTRILKVDPPLGDIQRGDYEVPEPKPISTDYQIGAYYFPGWPELPRWEKQTELPERDPLLGWYAEGMPEVADWHIKWAVENGISFFVYDWYWWKKGEEHLGQGLNDGFLKARYSHLMKFAVMWANHKPFATHTREQLLTVTDYWLKHYLHRPNYLTVDGKPYVSFYSPHELLTDLGSPEKVREAFDAMRERVRAAGLPGLHIAAIDLPGSKVKAVVLKEAGFDSWTAYTYVYPGTTTHSLYRQYMLSYRARWDACRKEGALPYVPAMAVGWDGPVWYGLRSERRRGRRTEDLKEGLAQLKAYLDETGGKMAILEAWNEWGEGAYFEPNIEFGFGDLEAIRGIFAKPGDWPVNLGPEDVGLPAGHYDLRNKTATTQPQGR